MLVPLEEKKRGGSSKTFGDGPTNPVPEPGALALLIVGVGGLMYGRHHRRKRG